MRSRVQRRKRQRVKNSLAKDSEPPDPISLGTALVVSSAIGGAAAIATPFINKGISGKAAAAPKTTGFVSPLAGEDTKLKPGEKVNAINTGPQGLLNPATTGRNTLLGG